MKVTDPNQKYTRLEKVAQGSYGVVYKARNNFSKEIVAIKKFKNHTHQGLPVSFVRELNILASLSGKHTLKQIQNFPLQQPLIVIEWMDLSLNTLLKSSETYNCKQIFREIVQGVNELHQQYIMHRDLKPANIMLKQKNEILKAKIQQKSQKEYQVKIIDYGMAKQISWNGKPITNIVGSLYYKAPQLILGEKNYAQEVDIWSLGCIFFQILRKNILFKSQNQIDQLKVILSVTGLKKSQILSGSVIEGLKKLKLQDIQQNWEKIKSVLGEVEFDLLRNMLRLNPKDRISCNQILDHAFFH